MYRLEGFSDVTEDFSILSFLDHIHLHRTFKYINEKLVSGTHIGSYWFQFREVLASSWVQDNGSAFAASRPSFRYCMHTSVEAVSKIPFQARRNLCTKNFLSTPPSSRWQVAKQLRARDASRPTGYIRPSDCGACGETASAIVRASPPGELNRIAIAYPKWDGNAKLMFDNPSDPGKHPWLL
ncbi:hypothetical protein PGTUg99_033608 [Puccinia graminis f. sp. tritici]|uniref:Uncharacterized protein n=1 Tax=Puccinia graminis f. sp. tritici TaxID=56615 RepID=A0A5B0P5C3_PUCGR|nr:hypothetical protein PGTUg99_033608 [Puccinia graminis f. sp. tritici]